MELCKKISNSFWSEDIWLPSDVTWSDVEPGSNVDIRYADYRHLLWPIPLAITITILRYITEKYLLAPLGKSLGVRSTQSKPPEPNKLLEEAYRKSHKLNYEMLMSLRKESSLTDRQIERWYRKRRAQDRPTILVKFCENGWLLLYYLFSFTFGLALLRDKLWFWDSKLIFYNYPHQSFNNALWWYYMITVGFYWSITFSQFHDVKRKDFWQMFIHHIIGLLMLHIGWVCNVHRLGLILLFIHDISDVPLYTVKCLKYANLQKFCDIAFMFFTVVWMVTRLIMFPRIVLYSSIFEMPTIVKIFPMFYCLISLLIILLIINLIWTYSILQILVQSIKVGKMDGDVRSSSEDDISDSSLGPKNGTRL